MTEYASKIEHTSKVIELHFKMFYKGNPIIVTIDDKLPFLKRSSDKELSLVDATSKKDDKFYLTSFYEKAVVKQACFKSYDLCKKINPEFVFPLLSDCLMKCCFWIQEKSKETVLNSQKFEVDNKSLIVLQ